MMARSSGLGVLWMSGGVGRGGVGRGGSERSGERGK